MPTVACVLKSGGGYSPEWVWALKRNVAEHLTDYEFRVLSDLQCFGSWNIPLTHRWPGWWSKLELFRPGLFAPGPVLYLDLDTLVTGDLSELASYAGPLAMVTDFYRPQFAQTGVMAWNPGPLTDGLWETFLAAPQFLEMQRTRDDGQWMHLYTVQRRTLPDRLQDLYPGQVVSYKVDATLGPPPNARLVCFHGQPKQDNPRSGWANAEWRRLHGPAVVRTQEG